MFGYVTVNKEELKIRGWEAYNNDSEAFLELLKQQEKDFVGSKIAKSFSRSTIYQTVILCNLHNILE